MTTYAALWTIWGVTIQPHRKNFKRSWLQLVLPCQPKEAAIITHCGHLMATSRWPNVENSRDTYIIISYLFICMYTHTHTHPEPNWPLFFTVYTQNPTDLYFLRFDLPFYGSQQWRNKNLWLMEKMKHWYFGDFILFKNELTRVFHAFCLPNPKG